MDTTTTEALLDQTSSAFPVPFTLDDFRKDVCGVYLHHVRTIAWMTTSQVAATLIPGYESEDARDLMWEATPEELGVTYERIKDTTLMRTLERVYRYAYFGELDASYDRMEDESVFTWTCAVVYDAAHGRLALEWFDNGSVTANAAERCLTVCELANARHILNGGEGFYYKFGNYTKEATSADGCLTIRQMALLAGMEEMSIRAAANKKQKRANPLETYTDENGTRVALDVAKAWLQSKNRYVPITVRWSEGELDLTKTRFVARHELWHALTARIHSLAEQRGNEPELRASLPCSLDSFIDEHLADEQYSRKLAEVLELPPDLFALRCKEIDARERLQAVERALKAELAAATGSTQA